MAIWTDLVRGRDLKVGDIYTPNRERNVFYKITAIRSTLPGKHATIKSVYTAKDIFRGKTLTGEFKDSDEKLHKVGYIKFSYAAIYGVTDDALLTGVSSAQTIPMQQFEQDSDSQKRLQTALVGKSLQDGEAILCIKYVDLSEKDDESENTEKNLLFWDLVYIKPSELVRYGIN
ncbi:MAG: hypothetical protein WAQ53_13085 [Thiofilum sp.]|uniref:hypothetical protein n=1 Tax=Thiofilum sp. TaxID=2212733 RepID=UPI0025D4CBD0|nr:hypothetical protein [Thiofilum sp.]MBK8453767.1 hypothetical protein [Thiofilum sp.]